MNIKYGMTVAAVACAASLFASDTSGIASANVVGYQQKDLIEGWQGVGATFIAVAGADQCKMSDLTVTGYEGSYTARKIYCSKLDVYGRSIQKMYWFDFENNGQKIYGWYTKQAECLNDVSLLPGEAVWFKAPEGIKLQSSGQVLATALPVALTTGFSLCANPTPVSVKMSQIFIDGYGDSYSSRGIYATKLDEYGRSIEHMYWFDMTVNGQTVYGWYSKQAVSFANVVVASGESLWVKSPMDGLTLTWPSAL